MSRPSESTDQGSVNPMFQALGTFLLRFRWAVLAATLAASGALMSAAGQARTDMAVDSLLASKSEAAQALDEVHELFGQDQTFLVVVEGDVFSSSYLGRLRELHASFAELSLDLPSQRPGLPAEQSPADDEWGDEAGWGAEGGGSVFEETTSLINVKEMRWKDGGLVVAELLESPPADSELEELRRRVLADDTKVGRLVGQAGTHSVVILRTGLLEDADSARVYEAIKDIAATHQHDDFQIHVAGWPALSSSMSTFMMEDVGRTVGLTILIMFVVLIVVFRHPIGLIGPVLVVAQSIVAAIGAMALADMPLTMVTSILPSLLICVGLGDALHLQSVYRRARVAGLENHDAIVHAVGRTGPPIVFTSLTTAAGLISFRLAELDAISDLGTAGSVGVLAAMVHSLVFLPILLSFNNKSHLGAKAGARSADWAGSLLRFADGLSRPAQGAPHSWKRRNRALLALAGVTALSVIGLSTVQVSHDSLRWFPEHSAVRTAFTVMDEHVGGTAEVVLLVEANNGSPVTERRVLLALEQLEQHIATYTVPSGAAIIGTTTSILNTVREGWQALHRNDAAHNRIPDTDRSIADTVLLFGNGARDTLDRLLTIDHSHALMVVQVRWLDAGSYAGLAGHVREGVKRHLSDLASVRITGSVFNGCGIVSTILSDLLESFLFAFVVIALMLMAVLRSVKLGLIAMIPNVLPIVAVLGLMGWAGIPIDLNNMLLASLVMGIAVDDTVHFFYQLRFGHQRGEDVDRAISAALEHSGRAILATTVVLVAGFGSNLAAAMLNTQVFGALLCAAVVFALISDLVGAPALLRWFYGSERQQSRPR